MLEQLIPSRRAFDGADIIFSLNAEAQKRAATGETVVNATVGALLDDDGKLVVLKTIMDLWRGLTPSEVAPYAPIAGDPAYLKALVERHWPGLGGQGVGCATPGGSGALTLSIRQFLERGQALLTLAPYWGPYDTLAFENGARVETLPFPGPGHMLDEPVWRRKCEELMAAQGRLLLWLNDPCHNPTGRTSSAAGRKALIGILRDLSQRGPVTLLLDLAYLDYTREPHSVREALDDFRAFAEAEAKREGGVLVGAALSLSKAFTLYGGRAGALVFPWCEDQALQAALAVSCRGIYSNCARAPQSLMVKLSKDAEAQARLAEEHAHWSSVLETRAMALHKALRAEHLPGLTWQGGFFTTLDAGDPRTVCDRLKEDGVFVVPMPEGLRIGICGMKAGDAPRLAAAYKKAL
ncbi:MAG TPA: aminotransferase class I/II-fold pyridoxal phosphate-dependent enzyme [Holophagaceae bacterium]|nr:aminotransferase class I/II-fold pyridoxal phosphate-dependent enzyme [Holophagaceae bacterium]